MKRVFHFLAVTIIVMCFASCNRALAPNSENPPEVALHSANFDVLLLDYERGYVRDSSYCFEGELRDEVFYFGHDKKIPMVPNIFPNDENRLEFKVSSDVAGFEGVNASSSSRCVNIVQDGTDHTKYHLEWVAEGTSTITFWNGEGNSMKKKSFTVTSYKTIPLVGIKFRYGDSEYAVTRLCRKKGNFENPEYSLGYEKESLSLHNKMETDASRLPVLEIYPDPLNANAGPEGPYEGNLYLYVEFSPSSTADVFWNNNVSNYPGFRWPALDTMHDAIGAYMMTGGEIGKRKMEWFERYGRKILPCDIRERRIKFFDEIGFRVSTKNPFDGRLKNTLPGTDLFYTWIDSDDNYMRWTVVLK